MQLVALDWAVIAVFFLVYLVIGLAVSRKAGGDFENFFLSGRAMPWWLLGTSMVATTFATDTPNLVTGIVRRDGVFGNWVWWAFLLTGTLTVFIFAKLWRRSGLLTDIEFYELRYSGKTAAFLRGFRAAYLGVFFNLIIMANVTLAAIKIGSVMLGLTPLQTITIAGLITVIYSMSGGLEGVLLTDLVQFVVAMAGAICAAIWIVNLPEVGGLTALVSNPVVQTKMSMLPDFSTTGVDTLLAIFILPLVVQWWATYYPGAEPGGGGYVVQRILAAKNERHAAGATLLFNALHYALRPWPWILVALASVIVIPDLATLRKQFPSLPESMIQHDLAYPAMLTRLPAGLLGVVVASLIAAYMSTMSTQLNYGASIIVNDLYRRFLKPQASQRHLVWTGRVTTLVLMVFGCGLALLMRDALSSFELMLQIGAGTGLLLILRWFWWRINAISELTALIVSFVVAVAFFALNRAGYNIPFWAQLVGGVAITTIAWIIATFASKPTSLETLQRFYDTVQPAGPGWRPVVDQRSKSAAAPTSRGTTAASDLPASIACMIASTLAIWSLIFASGYFLYGRLGWGVLYAAIATGGTVVVLRNWPRLRFK